MLVLRPVLHRVVSPVDGRDPLTGDRAPEAGRVGHDELRMTDVVVGGRMAGKSAQRPRRHILRRITTEEGGAARGVEGVRVGLGYR